MASPRVVAVLVAHASGSRLEDAMRALHAQTARGVDTFLVLLGDVEVPKGSGLRPKKTIRLPADAGFAHGVNEALAELGETEHRYAVLMHDDAFPEPDALAQMVKLADEDPDIAAVGAKLVDDAHPDVLLEVGGFIDRFATRRTGLEADEIDAGQRDDASDVLFASDAFLLVRLGTFRAVGGLDVATWPLYEDVDLCWRLRSHGHRVVVSPHARVRHTEQLSRGARPAFDQLELRRVRERERLRFMLRHYSRVSLSAILPQYVLLTVWRIVSSLLRRELWGVRISLAAWRAAFRDFGQIREARASADPNWVEDRELLRLAAPRAIAERRGERIDVMGRMAETWRVLESRARSLVRDPIVWTWVVAVLVVAVTMRELLGARTFTLGELRRFPGLGGALSEYARNVRGGGVDHFAPGTPGLVVLGLLRVFALGRAAFAEKLALLVPLVLGAVGAFRLARTTGLGGRTRGWATIAGAVNPATLVLLRNGQIGPLFAWGAGLALVASMLAPSDPHGRGEAVRRAARWAFGWAVVVALHPPALLWFLVIGAAIAVTRRPDGQTRRRLIDLSCGAFGAFVLTLPWSLEWFTVRSPLIGRGAFVAVGAEGLDVSTFGASWPLYAWVALAVGAALFVGLTRTSVAMLAVGGAAWIAGALGWIPGGIALVAVGVAAMVLLISSARQLVGELRRTELGAGHAVAIAGVGALAAVFAFAAGTAVVRATNAHTLDVLPSARERVGRVLWIEEATGGLRVWSTSGFDSRLRVFPEPVGPGQRLVEETVRAARERRTHRAGGVLALADLSHVVVLDEGARAGLDAQSDLSPTEEQAGALVLRNDAWRGPGVLLSAPPLRPLTARGLADIVREPRVLRSGPRRGGNTTVVVPDDARGVVYVAGGARGGWRIGGQRARIAASGVYVPASNVAGTIPIRPPPGMRWLLPIQALLASLAAAGWLVGSYVGRPVRGERIATAGERAPRRPRVGLAAAGVLVCGGAALAWLSPTASAGGPFLSTAWYCPPVGRGFVQGVAITNPGERRVDYLVRPSLEAAPVASGTIAVRNRESLAVEPTLGAVVESYGGRLVVASQVSRQGLPDSTLCASAPRGLNVFPEGGRFATRARPRLFEAYVVYNPFPDLARASVRFIAPEETISPPALRDVRVPPGEFVVIDPEDQFEPMLDLSAEIRIWQGRALVARRLRTVEQTTWSMASEPVTEGVIPRASTHDALTKLVAVNPGREPARVTVSASSAAGSLPTESFDVPENSRSTFDLTQIADDVSSMLVRFTSTQPVVIESLVVPDDRSTVSLLPPLEPAQTWVVPMAEGRALRVANPGTRPVRVSFETLSPGPDVEPVVVRAGRVRTVLLEGTTPFGVVVRARGGTVVVAAVGRAGSLAGVPLD